MTKSDRKKLFGGSGYFLSQPHQPFFLSGILWALAAMVLFAGGYLGGVPLLVPPQFFHAYSMLFMVFTPFFTGFIFTTFPRFCQSMPIARSGYTRIFFLSQIGSLLVALGAVTVPALLALGVLIVFGSHLLVVMQLQRSYTTGVTSHATSDPLWILVGFYSGLAAHLLFVAEAAEGALGGSIGLFPIAAGIGFWLYLVFVAFAVAQRMVPFFSHVMTPKQRGFSAVVFSLLVLKVLFGSAALAWPEIMTDIVLAIYILRELLRWKLPLFRSPAILWVLHLALFWLPAALLAGAAADIIARVSGGSIGWLQLHLAAIGFLTLLLIGFGTRVALGHSGQTPHADTFAAALFWLVQAVALLRAAYALDTRQTWLFDLSFGAWLLLFILWAWRFGPVLVTGKKL